MANTMGIDFDADKTEQQRDWGQQVTYSGTVYDAIVSIPTEGRDFESDGSGYYVTRSLIIEISKAKIGTAVATGDTFTYEGDTFRVSDLGPEDESGWYYLTLQGEAL
jgi:hypothetical protein